MTVVVAQLGARMHYAVPSILTRSGRLDLLYTDLVATQRFFRMLRALPAGLQTIGLKRMLGRSPSEIPADRITAFSLFGLRYLQRRKAARTPAELLRVHLWAGETFCKLAVKRGLRDAGTLFAYNSAGLELLFHARSRGLHAVVEQTICPRAVEIELLREEVDAFPAWANGLATAADARPFIEREFAEWREADLILCGSAFVRDGIAQCGGPVERTRVVPYGIDVARFLIPNRQARGGPLRVLTVGSVGLRKGSPYVLAAARRMKGRALFRMAGNVRLPQTPRLELAQSVQLLGAVPGNDLLEHLAWADVFLLPSICEGSATAVYEAMAAGLPVVCTPNTGSVARHGIEGYVVPIRDVDALVDALEKLAADGGLRAILAVNARRRAEEFDLSAYRRHLLSHLIDPSGPQRRSCSTR
jgi:glycosyltransferase involved in cell wall biosynthesis